MFEKAVLQIPAPPVPASRREPLSAEELRAMFSTVADPRGVFGLRVLSADELEDIDPVLVGARERLEELLALEPSAETLGAVVSFLGAEVAPHDRVLVVRLLERHAAWIAGCQQQAIIELADAPTGGFGQSCVEDDFADLELAAALRLSPTTASRRVETARQLTGRLRATGDALRAGLISFWYAVSLVEAVAFLDDPTARLVEAVALDGAENLPLAKFRARIRRAVIAAQPKTADEQHVEAARERRVTLTPEPDGMAWLSVYLTAPEAIAAYRTLDYRARRQAGLPTLATLDEATGESADANQFPSQRAAFDRDPIDTLRADAFLAAVLAPALSPDGAATNGAGIGGGVRLMGSHVHVTADAATLLGLANNPAELDGYGPIPPELARQLAADGSWQRMATEPITGHLLDYGKSTYRPPAALARYIRARDVTCRFPGCNRKARRSDLDHAQSWDTGGHTSSANLGALCRRHHNAKTRGGWGIESEPDGTATFTSPSGHRYRQPAADHNPEHTAHQRRQGELQDQQQPPDMQLEEPQPQPQEPRPERPQQTQRQSEVPRDGGAGADPPDETGTPTAA